jgi:hypothetical protein
VWSVEELWWPVSGGEVLSGALAPLAGRVFSMWALQLQLHRCSLLPVPKFPN